MMAGASGNSGTPAIQGAGDFAGLEAVADAGGYDKAARFCHYNPPTGAFPHSLGEQMRPGGETRPRLAIRINVVQPGCCRSVLK